MLAVVVRDGAEETKDYATRGGGSPCRDAPGGGCALFEPGVTL